MRKFETNDNAFNFIRELTIRQKEVIGGIQNMISQLGGEPQVYFRD